MRIVHYLNQFFAGIGGEEAAGTPPGTAPGPAGPGRALQRLLGAEHEILATVWCGDDHAAREGVVDEILALCRRTGADLLVTGPAFSSGRYGLACARLAAAAAAEGLASVAAMHPDNPGLDEAGAAPVIEAGESAREMAPALERLAAAIRVLAGGRAPGPAEGRIGRAPRRNRLSERTAAERAVDLALAHLAGRRDESEIPMPRFDRIHPAAPVESPSEAVVALVTEGGLVPAGNPGRLESARATRWLRYPLAGVDALEPGAYQSIHGGFSTVAANEDPHRILPLDAARELERRGAIGGLHAEYLVTVGNGTPVSSARRFGVEWAAELRNAGVQAVVLTST